MEALFFNDQKFYDFDEASEYFEDQIGRLNLELSKSKETLECTVRNHSQEIKALMNTIKEKNISLDYLNNQLHKQEESNYAKDEEIKDLNAEIYLLQQKIEHKNEKIRKLEKSMSKLIIKFLK